MLNARHATVQLFLHYAIQHTEDSADTVEGGGGVGSENKTSGM